MANARLWQFLTLVTLIGMSVVAGVGFSRTGGNCADKSEQFGEAEPEGDAEAVEYINGGPSDVESALSLQEDILVGENVYELPISNPESLQCDPFCASCVASGGGQSCLTQCAGCGAMCLACVRNDINSGTCMRQGQQGQCRSSSLCEASGGTAYPGLCASSDASGDNACCIGAGDCATACSGESSSFAVGDSCRFPNTRTPGVCRDTADCAGRNGVSVRGLCAGPSNIRCCSETTYGSCTAGGVSGVCRSTSTCTGTSTAGLCPGPTGIQCCTGGGGGGGGGTTTSPPATASCSGLGRRSTYKAYRRGSYIGTIQTVKLQGKDVEVGTACAFKSLSAGYGGRGLTINSGFRTMAQQEYFYNCYRTKRCNNGNLAARPGYSNHQNGIALDLSTGGASGAPYRFLKSSASRYGFVRTVGSEIWHWEYRPGSRCNAFVNYSCT
eukprot:PLAT7034.3.p2 GENE.PLAT7034.3~~PLAT7034.3.p2  ORF type:complete len:441 (+),score=164.87 PLAT7034.3:97-1419(+)